LVSFEGTKAVCFLWVSEGEPNAKSKAGFQNCPLKREREGCIESPRKRVAISSNKLVLVAKRKRR